MKLHKVARLLIRFFPAALIVAGITIMLTAAGSSDYGLQRGTGEPTSTTWAAFGGLALSCIGAFCVEVRRGR